MYPDINASVYLAWIVKEYIDQHQISCMECPAQSEDLKILSVWRKRKIDLEKHGHITSVTKRYEARGGHSEYLERDRREFYY